MTSQSTLVNGRVSLLWHYCGYTEERLAKPGAPTHLCDDEPRRRLVADDLAAMIRGMTDAAGERGERDVDDLAYRIGAAVFGYLAVPPRQM